MLMRDKAAVIRVKDDVIPLSRVSFMSYAFTDKVTYECVLENLFVINLLLPNSRGISTSFAYLCDRFML